MNLTAKKLLFLPVICGIFATAWFVAKKIVHSGFVRKYTCIRECIFLSSRHQRDCQLERDCEIPEGIRETCKHDPYECTSTAEIVLKTIERDAPFFWSTSDDDFRRLLDKIFRAWVAFRIGVAIGTGDLRDTMSLLPDLDHLVSELISTRRGSCETCQPIVKAYKSDLRWVVGRIESRFRSPGVNAFWMPPFSCSKPRVVSPSTPPKTLVKNDAFLAYAACLVRRDKWIENGEDKLLRERIQRCKIRKEPDHEMGPGLLRLCEPFEFAQERLDELECLCARSEQLPLTGCIY